MNNNAINSVIKLLSKEYELFAPKKCELLTPGNDELVSAEGLPSNYETVVQDGKDMKKVTELFQRARDYLRGVKIGHNFEYSTLQSYSWGSIVALDDWRCHLKYLGKYIPSLELELGIKLTKRDVEGKDRWFMVTTERLKNQGEDK